jgi:hypothetical protein
MTQLAAERELETTGNYLAVDTAQHCKRLGSSPALLWLLLNISHIVFFIYLTMRYIPNTTQHKKTL